ncbi:MAG: hypothetical protein GY832_42065 [Chloroflexi bacterium]|nr:hypothetical protein [Chloroflexota bacterium]
MKKKLWIASLLVILSIVSCGDEWIEETPPVEETTREEEIIAEEEPAQIENIKEEIAGTDVYVHPSGIFSVDMFSPEYTEDDDGVIFYSDTSYVMVHFTETGDIITEDNVNDVADTMLSGLLQNGWVEDFEIYADETETSDGSYLVYFWYSDTETEGDGEMFFLQDGQVLYTMILLTFDYDGVVDAWYANIASLRSSPDTPTDQVPPGSGDEQVTPLGTTDSGFRPETDGFSFENYGDEFTSLTSREMQRMFGDQICASMANNECTLTPPARQWMEQMNQYMADGHCEGMAVLSSLIYYDQVDPKNFGSSVAHDLVIEGNDALQREIAYWWITQGTYPGGYNTVNESPSAVLDTLIDVFNEGQNASEWWALGIYKSDGTGGHAITPFAVTDQGNSIYHILVYDNNYPGETRFIEVDRNAETWQYEGSSHPEIESDLYDGNADLDNLEVVSISPRLDQQECEFCAEDDFSMERAPGMAAFLRDSDYYEIWLQGHADLLIVTEDGQRIGYVNGEFVNEIPGASAERFKFYGIDVWAVDKEPVYHIPVGTTFEIIVDGSQIEQAESSEVTMIGPGYFLSVEDIWLEPGEMDSIDVTIDESRHQLTYITDYAESPVVMLGMETDEEDYAFMVQATEITGIQDTFDVGIDLAEGDFIINTSYNEESITFDFLILRIDDQGERVFGGSDLVMEPENTAYLNYLEWVENGSVMYLDMDYENDGEIDESFELPDEADEFYWDVEE